MKRIIWITFFILQYFFTKGQDNYVGNYRDYNRNIIYLYSDFTFYFSSSYPYHGWTKGTWKAVHDTLYLTCVPIYDTLVSNYILRFPDSPTQVTLHSIVLSYDEESSIVYEYPPPSTDSKFTYQQNSESLPDKLFLKRNVLYCIDPNSKFIIKRVKKWNSNKKIRTGYIRIRD